MSDATHEFTELIFEGRIVPVTWQVEDLRPKVAVHIKNGLTAELLYKTGVFYDGDQTVTLSDQIAPELQPFAALHETLCMKEQIDACSSVEQRVINSSVPAELSHDFIDLRRTMFRALTIEYPDSEPFAASFALLDAIQ